jgi:serine/threonine protein phosphatase PrpC
VLTVDDICYVANTGDSRAIMCLNGGKNFVELTNDHKPEDPIEKNRIEMNGGKVYQNFS